MRRLTVALLTAASIGFWVPGGALAAPPPPPTITSVTITAAGGDWPICHETATVTYATWHRRVTLNVMPVWWGATGAAAENNFVGPLRGTGTATVEISNDYTTTSAGYWTWMAALLYPHPADSRVDTTHYSFDGTCPTSGVVASWGL